MDELKSFQKQVKIVKKRVDMIIEILALQIIYLFGIGLTFIISKIFAKQFLQRKYKESSWNKYLDNKDSNKMF